MEADRADAGVVDEAVGEVVAVGLPRALARAQLDRDRQAEPSRAARATATAVPGSLMSAAPAPVLHTLGTGQPMLRSMRSAPRSATVAAAERMTSGSWPKSWIETGPPARSVGMDAQQLAHRLLVAVVDGEARDHLRDREARPRSAWPAGARTSCRSRPGARAAPDWGPRRARSARACRAQALRSCNKRRPVRVRRSSVSSISSVKGRCAGRPPVAIVSVSSPISARRRRTMPSTGPRSRRPPLRMASRSSCR